jgi:phosphonate transport system substrate-binding protein
MFLIQILFAVSLLVSCHFHKAELGTNDNPIKIFFTPFVDSKVLDESSKDLKEFLEKDTGYKFEMNIPQSYIAVVEAFGSKRVDCAVINTFGYLLAHNKYGAEARLIVVRYGQATYQGEIITLEKNKSIQSLKDLAGKKFAFVDPASMSGFIVPSKMFKEAGIILGETIFAQKHDAVVSMVYQGRVDAGAAFYSPPVNGEIQDARILVRTQYPDVEKKIKVLGLTKEIPNDPVAFRKDVPEEIKLKVSQGFINYIKTSNGKEIMKKLLVTDFKIGKDSDYDGVQKMLRELNLDLNKLNQK